MGRKALLTVVCWLTLNKTFGDKVTHSSTVIDNESAESASRLYRNVPFGTYASAAPYAAYSFQLPTVVVAPNAAASQVAPVKENYVSRLTDSYGNRFVGTPQLPTYKFAFPQQYVSLQNKLPEHLAQPLVAASANFQFKPTNGQFVGVPYRVPGVQTFVQLHGNNPKNLAPSLLSHKPAFGVPNTHQQSTNNKAIFTTSQAYGNGHSDTKLQKIQEAPHSIVSEQKFQRIQKPPHTHSSDAQRNQESHYSESKPLKQKPHDSQGETKFRVQELPHYENKFQIIEDQSLTPQFQRIQEHHSPHGEVKFQRLQEVPSTKQAEHSYEESDKPEPVRYTEKSQYNTNKVKLQATPGKQTITYINDINGEKTVVELDTKPSLPLLDITLLEPLTFDNPLVPQVQHFLPRINQATYQKLPELNIPKAKTYQKEYVSQKTSSYGGSHEKPYRDAPKKKQKKPTHPSKKNDAPKKTTVNFHDTLDNAPEITYEISAPNYKETVKEKSVSYNMRTQSEPVHYTYGSKSEKEPVTYTYTRTVKEPIQIQSVHYEGNGPSPVLQMFHPKQHAHEETPHSPALQNSEHTGKEKESSHESDDGTPTYHHQHYNNEQFDEHPKSPEEHHEHHEVIHSDNGNYYKQNVEKPSEVLTDNLPKYHSEPAHFTSENINFQPILKEYENNIRLLTTPSASIKVDPIQHVHPPKSTPQSVVNHHEEHSQPQQQQQHQQQQHQQHHHHPQPSPVPQEQSYNRAVPHIHEKSKHVIIQEESPDEKHSLREQMREEVVDQEENSEEDFEKSYQDAAIGFPAYHKKSLDTEKDIFDPESYGIPQDHIEYDFEHTPFQQYHKEGDEFPKETRANYKDARDKMMQNYYSDFSISKPEGLLDRYQNKLNYYKLYKEQKPDYFIDTEENNKKQKSAKYSVAPVYNFHPSQDKAQIYYGHPKPKQQLYEYDFSKGVPRDNSAFASRPYQNYKTRTSFVEPQYQYGFEPIPLPKILDSELAAMASNDSPESEKPGMRKKIYKENWYIKKTRTSAGAPAS